MGKYIDGSGLSHFMGIIKGTFLTSVDYNSTTRKITKTKGGTASDVVTLAQVATSGSYADLSNKPTIPGATSTTPKMDGTAAVGSETTWAKGDHVHPSDTSRVPTTRTVNGKALSANISLGAGDIYIDNALSSPNVKDSLNQMRIDGVSFGDYDDTTGRYMMTHYGTCSTAAATAAKTVALTGFELVTGAWVAVKFTVTNTAAVASLTLNVNSTGAKAIKYRGANLSSVGLLAANRTYLLVYDGTNWEIVGDLDTNITYSDFTYSAHGLVPQPPASLGSYEKEEMVVSADGAWRSIGEVLSAASGVTNGLIKVRENNDEIFVTNATADDVPALPASKVTSGTFDAARIPSLAISKITNLQTTLDAKAPLASPALTGTPTAPTAAAGTSTTQIATTAFVTNAVGTATAGALQYKGTATQESDISGQAYKKGWYYVVSTAGTYFGKVCEVGDMLIAKQDKTSTPANDWDAIQSNIEVLSNSEIDTLWAAA